MRVWRSVAVACVALGLSSCGARPQDLIVGKWQSTEPNNLGLIEFTREGTVIIGIGGLALKGTYRFIDDKTVEVAVDNPLGGFLPKDVKDKPGGAKLPAQRFQITSIGKDELAFTDPQGKAHRLKRQNTP